LRQIVKNLTVKNRDKREIFFEFVILYNDSKVSKHPQEGEPVDHCDLFNSENQDNTI